jgi:hypothetical protein
MLDNPNIAAGIAAANAAEASGQHEARAAAASATLKAWEAAYRPAPSAQPTDAIGAAARLTHLEKDAGWRNKLFAGEAQAREEMEALTALRAAGNDVDLAIAGHLPAPSVDENFGAVAGGPELVAGAAHLRELGFNDLNIAELYEGAFVTTDGKPLTQEEIANGVRRAEQDRTFMLRDPEIMKKYLSGDAAVRQNMDRLAMIIITGGGKL